MWEKNDKPKCIVWCSVLCFPLCSQPPPPKKRKRPQSSVKLLWYRNSQSITFNEDNFMPWYMLANFESFDFLEHLVTSEKFLPSVPMKYQEDLKTDVGPLGRFLSFSICICFVLNKLTKYH